MKLLTKEIEKRFKKVGSQQEVEDPIVVAKFFNPLGSEVWFATEYNPEMKAFFGYVSLVNDLACNEFGYFSLEELEGMNVGLGLGIERDSYCEEKTLHEWKKYMGIV